MSGLFAESYEEARHHFVEALEASGFRHMRHRISSEDGQLFQDYGLLRRDPRRLLVHISGVHGVEGYPGSAVQRDLLSLPLGSNGPSLLFLHALNPYGMALFRRANAENVDLNRNFRQGPADPNPDYALFHSYLSPESRLQFLTGLLGAFFHYKRIGKARASMAVAAGQTEFPSGAFYMGTGLQREIRLFLDLLKTHGAEAEEVTVIDFHTGLGEFGGELLFVDKDGEPGDPDYFQQIFGRPVSFSDPAAGIYKNQGPLWDGVRAALGGKKVHYVLQEIGTHRPGVVLGALREENFDWNRRKPGAERPERVRRRMLEAFCPASPEWRAEAVRLGRERWQQAERALSR